METSYTLLTDLMAGRCSNTAKVQLLRFWQVINTSRTSSRSGELMSIDMLLIDENWTLMQGSIAAARQLRFRQSLSKGLVYSLTGFDVTRSNPNNRRYKDGQAEEETAENKGVSVFWLTALKNNFTFDEVKNVSLPRLKSLKD